MAKNEKTKKADNRLNPAEYEQYVAAQAELRYLREKYGIEDPDRKNESKLSRMISAFFERQDARKKIPVNYKKFLLLLVFTGWCGGHRFYAHHYKLGIVYLLTCWTGFSIAMSIIDLLQFIPYEKDENGNIYV